MIFPILSLIMLAPVIGAVIILFIPKDRNDAIKTVAAASAMVSMLLSLLVVFAYNRDQGGFQFAEKASWIPSLGVSYYVAVDGFSAPLLLLNGIVLFCAVLVTWNLTDRAREFFAFLLMLAAGVFGAFMSLDLFLFLIFYELVLFPVYVLVAGWGSGPREYAAMKLTIYLFLGSLASILGLLVIYYASGRSFSFDDMQRGVAALKDTVALQRTWFLPVFIGFGVLASIWPLHNWSPDGYASAPTAVSMLHGGVLKATGAYAALRFGVQIMPEGAKYWLPVVAFLCLANVIYAGSVAFRQKDLKYIIGFASVAHLGLVLLGICALNVYGLNGAGIELFAGGVMTGLMFSLVGIIYERSHERDFSKLNGLVKVMPLAAVGFVIGSLTAMGMPGFSGFPAEMQIFMGLWSASQTNSLMFAGQLNWWLAIIAIVGVLTILITATWTLRIGRQMFFTDVTTPDWQQLPPLTGIEKVAIILPCIVCIGVGILPNSVMNIIEIGVQAMVKSIGG